MNSIKDFLKRKDIEISVDRYLVGALSAMAQGLFCSLLIGTIINTIGTQFQIGFLTETVATISGTDYTVGAGVEIKYEIKDRMIYFSKWTY